MNFESAQTLPPENIAKFLIFFHVLEIFSKSYEKSVASGKITLWPAEIQIQTARIHSWWKNQKGAKYFTQLQEKSILLEVFSFWEYIQ